jgi:hypothetical protein
MQNCITINRGAQSPQPASGGSRWQKRLSERRLNAPYGGGMLNVRMLNSELACVSQPDFREIFHVSGRFPRFKNPFKYIRGWQINQFSPLPGASPRLFFSTYQCLAALNALSKHLC